MSSMIRKFVVTNTQSSVSTGSETTPRSTLSPTSQIDSNNGEDEKKLYAQSLESTENSVVNEQAAGELSTADPLLYPVCSDERDTSTDGMFQLRFHKFISLVSCINLFNSSLKFSADVECVGELQYVL